MLSSLKRSMLPLAALVLLLSAPVEAQRSTWSADFGTRSVSVRYSKRGHRVTTRRYAPRKEWVPGRYVNECQRVWVEGIKRKVYVEPIFEIRYRACGTSYEVQVDGGYYKTVYEPGHFENRWVKVWKPGYWRVIHGRGR